MINWLKSFQWRPLSLWFCSLVSFLIVFNVTLAIVQSNLMNVLIAILWMINLYIWWPKRKEQELDIAPDKV